MCDRATELAKELGLAPHPEGGLYREVYRSESSVYPTDGRGSRPAITGIYFLLPAGPSAAGIECSPTSSGISMRALPWSSGSRHHLEIGSDNACSVHAVTQCSLCRSFVQAGGKRRGPPEHTPWSAAQWGRASNSVTLYWPRIYLQRQPCFAHTTPHLPSSCRR
jgi:hypothetical protein